MEKLPQKKQDSKGTPARLMLGPADPSLKEEGSILSTFAMVSKKIEAVGKGYAKLQAKVLKYEQRQLNADGTEKVDENGRKFGAESSDEDEQESPEALEEGDSADFESKRKKKSKAEIEKEALDCDMYALLGLDGDGGEYTIKDVTKAYRKAALVFHPDKLGDKLTAKDKEIWLKIQIAYETLIDPAKKKKYDSSLPFDDKIPKKGEFDDENFYEVFEKVFTRNAKFAVIVPLPSLGDKNTPIR
jgi:preprotein translocase subunit Sec63